MQAEHVRSVRFASPLDSRIRAASALRGISISDYIRRAATKEADHDLGQPSNSERLGIGTLHGPGTGYSRNTGEEFTKILVEKHERRRQ